MVKVYSIILIMLLGVFCGCADSSENDNFIPLPISKNEDILAKTLLYMEWSDLSFLVKSSYSEKRNLLISLLDEKCATPLNILKSKSDYDLSWGTMSFKFLQDYGYSNQKLSSLTLDEYRNIIIELNSANKGSIGKDYNRMTTSKNLITAYEWWLTKNAATKNIMDKLNAVATGNPIFGLKNNKGITMDVLRIVKADEEYTYLGVSHAMVSDGRFKLYLSGSNDLITWTQITELGDRAHQGDIEKWGNGYLVANEQDLIQGSNNIQIRYFNSYDDLIINHSSFEKSIARSLAPTAEGTPDIRKIEGSSPEKSHILIGFHFYENMIHDQQAFGVLQNFINWKAWIDVVSNHTVQEMGFSGNIGARSAFHQNNYVLMEAQITSHDWSSWRILFGNGAFYYLLKQQTPLSSTSFANPGIAQIGLNKYVLTSFMPSEGNKPAESGELLYTIQTQ